MDRQALLEIEMKFAVPDFKALKKRLSQCGARRARIKPRHEEDHYFNAPDRDFARTDEALRLRRLGAENFVTYKGPKRDRQTKTRAEIEVSLARGQAAAEEFCRLLRELGYRDVAIVRKDRWLYRFANAGGFVVEVCLDDVEGLGKFAELEILAPEAQLDAARAVLQQLAADLDLSGSERRSYLEMLLEKQRPPASAGRKPPG
jgi:adenylate cyclase class 2